jgi:hypothetical protein
MAERLTKLSLEKEAEAQPWTILDHHLLTLGLILYRFVIWFSTKVISDFRGKETQAVSKGRVAWGRAFCIPWELL